MPDEFCPACGRHGRPDDRFCRACGAALTDDASTAGPIAEAEALVARGLLSEAVAAVQRALGAHQTPELHVALATLYLRRGDADAAARELDRATLLDPGCAVAHAYAGALLARRGRIDEAQAALDRAKDLAPDDVLVAMKRAEFFIALGILGRAQDELRHGLADGGGTHEMRLAAARLLADVEKRLSRAVVRRIVRLPRVAALSRALGRGQAPKEPLTMEMEA